HGDVRARRFPDRVAVAADAHCFRNCRRRSLQRHVSAGRVRSGNVIPVSGQSLDFRDSLTGKTWFDTVSPMNRRIFRVLFCFCFLMALVVKTPAPLVYRPGEGWSYEPVGGGRWTRTRAKDQLDVAQKAFDSKDY